MDAENSPAAGLRNGLRSAVGFGFPSRMTLVQPCTFAYERTIWNLDALDEDPLPLRLLCSDAGRFDPCRIARYFAALGKRRSSLRVSKLPGVFEKQLNHVPAAVAKLKSSFLLESS